MKLRKDSRKRILLTYAFGISGIAISLLGFVFGSKDADSLFIFGIVFISSVYFLLQAYLTAEE